MKTLILYLLTIAACLGQGLTFRNPSYVASFKAQAAAPPAGGISVDATSRGASETSPSWTHAQGTIASGGYALVMVAWTQNSATSATVTYGGNAMTSIRIDANSAYYTALFYRELSGAELTGGNKTVAVTHNGTIYNCLAVCRTFAGVASGGGFTSGTGADYSTAAAASVATTSADEFVYAIVANGASTDPTQTHTLIYEEVADQVQSAQYAAGTGGTVNMTWTVGEQNWVASAVVLKVAP